MFDQSSYCNDCAKITLGADKIEEMILMTENQKKKALWLRPCASPPPQRRCPQYRNFLLLYL